MPGAPVPTPPPAGQPSGAANVAEAAVSQIKDGFQKLGQLMQSAGGGLDPQAMKLFQSAQNATDIFIQDLMSPAEAPKPQPKPPGGPMPMNANAQAKPAPQY